MYTLREYIRHEIFGGKKVTLPWLRLLYMRMISPSVDAIYLIRKYQILLHSNKCKLRTAWLQNKLVRKYGIFVGTTQIDIGLHLPHPNGIIFGKNVKLGKNARVFQQVTFGGKVRGDAKKGNQPSIGDDCEFYKGATVLGKIHVADRTLVGANAVLLQDTVEDGVYVGTPARNIKNQ